MIDVILAAYSVPNLILGVPYPDTWTTPYADMLQAIGEPELAAVERERACREVRKSMGVDSPQRFVIL